MDEIEKWTNMYQNQKVDPINLDSLVNRLNKAERIVKARRRLLIIGLLVLAGTMIIRFHEFENKFYILSYVLFVIAASIKLFALYKGKYDLINNESEFNNRGFINNHITKLKEKIIFEKKHLIVFLLFMIAALNFALLGMYHKGTLFNFDFNEGNRVYIHLSTVLLFFVGYYINSKKIIKYKHEILDLIEELESHNQL